MKNLTQDPTCDSVIGFELDQADIPIIFQVGTDGSVPYHFIGVLGGFTFTRSSTYWTVKGKMPLALAEKILTLPVGNEVRAGGGSGQDLPSITKWYTPAGVELATLEEKALIERYGEEGIFNAKQVTEILAQYLFVDPAEFELHGSPFIITYDIDSQKGLNMFVVFLRKHKLV